MVSRILSGNDDYSTFRTKFMERGNSVTLEYLRNSRVRGFFEADGTMVAGYAINTRRPLRYEEWIPAPSLEKIPKFTMNKDLCEITCIWIAGKNGRITSQLIYLRSVIDALGSGAAYILGGTVRSAVFGIQTQSLPEILYDGFTTYFGEPRRCWIYGASRSTLIGRLLTAFPAALIAGLAGAPNYLSKARKITRKMMQG
jgi:hypothetical protein